MFLSRECLASVVGIALCPVKDTVPQHSCSNREAQLGRRRAKGSLFPRLPRFLVLRVWFVAQFLRNRFSRLRSDWGLSFVVHLGLRSGSHTRTIERPRPFGKHLPGISGGAGRSCPWLQRRRLDRKRLRHRFRCHPIARQRTRPGAFCPDLRCDPACGNRGIGYPKPERWAAAAVPFLASLGPKNNGKALIFPNV